MIEYMVLALVNGIVIGISRAINSRLSIAVGPFKASFWNHIVGFLFLSILLAILVYWQGNNSITIHNIPVYTYLGGFFGAFFVAVNSYVFPRMGAMKTVLLVISGQMISSVLLTLKSGSLHLLLGQICGVLIIIFGIFLSRSATTRRLEAVKTKT